jgi:hypothetical protein
VTAHGLIDLASALVVALAVLAAAAVLVTGRGAALALPVLLDLLTAAGLLHLAGDPGYRRAASAAAILVVRRLLSWSLTRDKSTDRARPQA